MTLFFEFIFCLAASVFFSSAEMAFVSANLIKFREMADSGNPLAKKVLRLQENSQRFLIAILIGNNMVNIICQSHHCHCAARDAQQAS